MRKGGARGCAWDDLWVAFFLTLLFLTLLLFFCFSFFKPWCWCIRVFAFYIRSFEHVQICLVVGLFNAW